MRLEYGATVGSTGTRCRAIGDPVRVRLIVSDLLVFGFDLPARPHHDRPANVEGRHPY
jgi:hypothetical protein